MGRVRGVWKSARRNAGYGLFLALRAALGALPAGARLAAGAALGSAGHLLAGRERRRALEGLARAFGADRSASELRRIARESFRNLGRSAAELCGLWRGRAGDVLDLVDGAEGRERFQAGLAGGRGLVVVTAHLDNWELVGGWVATSGLPLTVVARRIYFEKYDRLVVEMRRKLGMEVVYQDESPRRLLRALRDGRMLAVLADQDIPRLDGVFVPFLGRPAYTPIAPVSLALASGAPLVLAHSVRLDGLRHRLLVSDPLEFDRSDKLRAVLEGTRAWTALLDAAVRRWPEQWVWMHRRWRTGLADRPEAAARSGYELPAGRDGSAAQPEADGAAAPGSVAAGAEDAA